MSKVKLLIVEDEMIVAEDMRQILEDLGYEVAGVTGDPQEARRLLAATKPDVALIDITLGTDQHGLELARYVKEEVNIPFIFCTSHADQKTVKQASGLHPNGYLVKPFDENDLYSSIEVALSNFADKGDGSDEKNESLIIDEFLFIKEGNLYVKVLVKEITYLSPEGNYTNIHVEGGKRYIVRSALKDFHNQLPGSRFFRTHRSYVVNIGKVSAINSTQVYIGDEAIPLGKNYRDELLSSIKRLH